MDSKDEQSKTKEEENYNDVSAILNKSRTKIARVESDRIALITQANDFVETMVNKEIYPSMMGKITTTELTTEEKETYNAALHFLKLEFDKGGKDPSEYCEETESEYMLKNE